MNTTTTAAAFALLPVVPGVPHIGDVVHFVGRTRRYVVSNVSEVSGHVYINLVALTGGERGSAPCVHPDQIVVVPGVDPVFQGPFADKFQRRHILNVRLRAAR
jgi:hypothetical protein